MALLLYESITEQETKGWQVQKQHLMRKHNTQSGKFVIAATSRDESPSLFAA